MSEASKGLGVSAGCNKVGPDYFGFYTREVAELLFQDEDFLPFSSQPADFSRRAHGVFTGKDITGHDCNLKKNKCHSGSGSLFCDAIGSGLSDYKKERLKALLWQSVGAFTQEVDEVLDPIVSMRQIQSYLRYKNSLLNDTGAACESDVEKHPHKKQKLSSSASISIPQRGSPVKCGVIIEDLRNEYAGMTMLHKKVSKGVKKNCTNSRKTANAQCSAGPEGSASLCSPCGINFKKEKNCFSVNQERESCLGSNVGAEKDSEVNDDLQYLLENDSTKVEETMKKYSDELSRTLAHMEQKIEELLNTVMSSCRTMTCAEKQQLRQFIHKLPPSNLDRIVGIVQHNKPSEECSSGEILVDLEKEDNVTLWRLYYHVKTVENARKLCIAPSQENLSMTV